MFTVFLRKKSGSLVVACNAEMCPATRDCYCSVAQLCLTRWPHGLQHARLSCPSPSPGVCSDSCPLSLWCYIPLSSSAASFSFCLQSFPASWSFPVNCFFASGGRSIGASASASVLPMNIKGRFLLGLTGLIFLMSKGLSRVCPSTAIRKHQFFGALPSLWTSSHISTWLQEKP